MGAGIGVPTQEQLAAERAGDVVAFGNETIEATQFGALFHRRVKLKPRTSLDDALNLIQQWGDIHKLVGIVLEQLREGALVHHALDVLRFSCAHDGIDYGDLSHWVPSTGVIG